MVLNSGAIRAWGALMILAGGMVLLNGRFRLLDTPWVPLPSDETAHRWDSHLLKSVSLGFWPAVVDAFWIRALQDQSLSRVPVGKRASIFFDFDLITDLDPAFFEVYAYGSTLLTVARSDSEGALSLLEKGEEFRRGRLYRDYPPGFAEKYWYHEWAIPMQIAFVQLFDFQNLTAAAEAYRVASAAPGAPEYLKSLSARLSAPLGKYDVGIRHLEFLMIQARQAGDDQLEKELEERRDSLIVNRELARMNDEFDEFLKEGKSGRERLRNSESLAGFLSARKQGVRDPWGGRYFLDENGRIDSTVSRKKVLGL